MRKLLTALMICLVIIGMGFQMVRAEDIKVSLKQGFLYLFKDQKIQPLFTGQIAQTKPIESWGKWNAIIDGWSLDIGGSYDFERKSLENGALLIGREFGTLGKYLPIDFPFKDKIKITLYPIGIYVKDVFDDAKISLTSGLGIIKLEVKF